MFKIFNSEQGVDKVDVLSEMNLQTSVMKILLPKDLRLSAMQLPSYPND